MKIWYHFESIDFSSFQYGVTTVIFNFTLKGYNCDIVPPSHFHFTILEFYPYHRIHHIHSNRFKCQKNEKNYDCIICNDDYYFWKLKRKYRVKKIIFINLPQWTEDKAKEILLFDSNITSFVKNQFSTNNSMVYDKFVDDIIYFLAINGFIKS